MTRRRRGAIVGSVRGACTTSGGRRHESTSEPALGGGGGGGRPALVAGRPVRASRGRRTEGGVPRGEPSRRTARLRSADRHLEGDAQAPRASADGLPHLDRV